MSPVFCILLSVTLLLPRTVLASGSLSEKQMEQWAKLLHFKGGNSTISSPDFFLSKNGSSDADDELMATISAFTRPSEMAHCRYPARYIWVKANFGSDLGLSLQDCDDYQQWIQHSDTESVSLVYVTGYLGNPASFFGHLMMKFNRRDDHKTEIELLDTGINFGADAHPDDNPVKYVLYGIFGGYSASYTTATYYLHTASYAENEQRELWEYELNLTEPEVALLQAHLFELQNVDFNYYFLSDNCSTAFKDILSIVLQQPLDTGVQPWDMPIDIFHALPEAEHRGKPLVKKVNQRQSKYSRIQNKYLALSDAEKQQALTIAKDISELTSFMQSDDFSDYEKAKVLDVLTEYTELLLVTKKESNTDYKEQKRKLLLARLQLASFAVEWPESIAKPPHLAQLPINLGMGAGYSDNYGSYVSLRGYGAYYDFLSIDAARLKDSALTVLDTELHVTEDKVRLKKLDFINIASLNTNDVDLFENDRLAWQLALSVEHSECHDDECYRSLFKGYLGVADRWFNGLSAYAMLGGQVDFAYFDDSAFQLPAGLMYSWSDSWKTHLRIVPSLGLNGEGWDFAFYGDTRFNISNKADVRFSVESSYDKLVGVYYNRYF
ncbi:Lnb N-terminal periplasmic domain-containing protein [Vibrio sp. SCSIO 43137]|uniref:Lnb N-terminal periplasmic domain-containing protein n=1 Tax=Vibrio sp. SCSIO 43137 TaxID=3021011 RepID=UPI002307C6AA|nr:DUF4105 domain-containing protein [Vibrio sp. SCSIO 43137]WCE30802.1 DUF4105 domain-containing protein [Vibrio sp. SCSIO 43137]